jgi:hypothetical protein
MAFLPAGVNAWAGEKETQTPGLGKEFWGAGVDVEKKRG